MIFYRLAQHTKLHSFGDQIGQVPIMGKTLRDVQDKYVHALEGAITDIEEEREITHKDGYFLFEENIFFTLPFLKSCIKIAIRRKKNLQFCLKRNSFNERFILPTSLDTDDFHQLNFHYHSGSDAEEKAVIEQELFEYKMQLPVQIIKGRDYNMDQCDTFAVHIISPFHLLFANLGLNLARSVKFQSRIPVFLRKKFGQQDSRWFYRGLKRLNKIGKNCKIHATALIEGSLIGDNVTIGAYSIVRMSTLESDCYVAENVSVINSVLGKRTFIANSNYISSCFTYPEVFLIHGPYQFSVFGEKSACFAIINCDFRLDQGTIKIPTSQGILDSHQPLLGIAYGHRSKAGGGNIIAAGRIVPNDLHINPPDNIILNFNKK